MLKQALELHKHFSIIPLKGKVPVEKWVKYQKEKATTEQVKRWFSGTDYNIGVVTGELSNLSVVDIDDANLYNDAVAKYGPTPIQVKTGKGFHLYYKYEDGLKNRARIEEGIDIRSEGGYVVAGGSKHESGTVYEMRTVGSLEEAIEALPRVNMPRKDAPQQEHGGITEGKRNDTVTKAVGRWAGAGLSFDEIYTLAYNKNVKECSPQLSDEEVRSIVSSIFKKEEEKRSIEVQDQIASIDHYSMEEPGDFLLKPPGLIGELADYINSVKSQHIPIFSVASSLATVGAMLGLRVKTETGLLTNLYLIGLADSGTGKNAPLQVLPDLIRRSAYAKSGSIICPGEVTSSAAIIRHMCERGNEAGVMFRDEWGHFLECCKRKGSFMSDILQLVTRMFSLEPVEKQYAKERLSLLQHCLSVFGVSTGESYWRNISATSAEDGNLARFMVVESSKKREGLRFGTFDNERSPKEILKLISKLEKKFPIRRNTNNLLEGFRHDPKLVKFSNEAREMVEAFSDKYVDAQNNAQNASEASIFARVCENAMKVSLTVACGDFRTVIEAPDFEWGASFAELCASHTVKMLEDRIFKNEIEEVQNKIIITMKRMLKKNGNKGVTMRDVTRAGHIRGLLNRTLKEIVDAMVSEGRIVLKSEPCKNGKTKDLYFVGR